MFRLLKDKVSEATEPFREGAEEMIDSARAGGGMMREGAQEISDTVRFMFTGKDPADRRRRS